MLIAPLPPDEDQRLETLYSLHLLDTPAETRFDDLAELAVALFAVPIAFVSLIDRERQFFKAKVGVELCESSREISFCSHAILREDALVIEDATEDPRFAHNPFVTSAPHLRFYAGHPLRVAGQKVGTLCLADVKPRQFGPDKLQKLGQLARMAERELAASTLLRDQSQLLRVQRELLQTRSQLEHERAAAALYVRSLLPAPISEPLEIDWEFVPSLLLGGDCLGYHALGPDKLAIYLFDVCGHGLEAALFSVAILSVVKSSGLAGVDFTRPAAVLNGLNAAFPMARHGNRFFTMWYGVYDVRTGELTYATAGHPAGLMVTAEGEPRKLATSGVPVGAVAGWKYAEAVCRFEPGDQFFVFSDGLFELRRNGAGLFVLEAASDALTESARSGAPLRGLLDQVAAAFPLAEFMDDVSIMRVRRR